MNLLHYILYFYLFLPYSAITKRIKLKTETDLNEANKTTTEAILAAGIDEKDSQYPVLMKMLLIASNPKNICHCNCTKDVQITTDNNKKPPIGIKIIMRNRPVKYYEENNSNNNISQLCPYYKFNDEFRMHKLPAVYWPKFYNMKENLKCFKIHVLKLTAPEMMENDFIYGNFNGKVDWSRCQFEIRASETPTKRRHFLMGDAGENGVMRNILITYNPRGDFTLHEESPDQWLMIRNLILLRDCTTGEVVVFTRTPHLTKTGDIVQALQELGEEMIGKMLCDEDDNWLMDDASGS